MPVPKMPQDHKAPAAKKTTARKRTTARTAAPEIVPETAPEGLSAATAPSSEDDKYALTSWARPEAEDLRVPSGQLCLVRRPGIDGLMEEGVLHNLDSLTSIIQEKHVKRVKGRKNKDDKLVVDTDTLQKDEEALVGIMHMVDRVVCHVVLKPSIQMTPNDVTRRQPGVVYCDMVDIEDRMFIFNYALGGTRSVERFREQSLKRLGGVDA